MRVAIQGEPGSFHHIAALEWFPQDITTVCGDTFPEVFGLLNRHEADAAIIAIENSLYGSINEVYDLIEAHQYPIVGEVHLRIEQQLISRAPSLDTITHVFSHPVALAQCQNWLDLHLPHAQRIETYDTAAAVASVAHADNSHAAIAGRETATIHNMPIIAENIEDNSQNYTRFLVIQPGGVVPPDADRTSLVLVTNHTPGALASILTIFADAEINLSKLQSRPIPGSPWKYRFYVVLDIAGDTLHHTLRHIKPLTQSLTILGEYKHNL